MSGKVLSRKVHRDGTSTIIRLVNDQAPARRASNPLSRLSASCRAVEASAARIAATVTPPMKPAAPVAQAAAPAKRKTTGINRFSRHQVPGERVIAQAQTATKGPAAPKAYDPDTSAIIGLRRAFGLPVSSEDVARTKTAMVTDHRAAKAAEKARKDASASQRKSLWSMNDLMQVLSTLGFVIEDRRLEEAMGERAPGVADDLNKAAVALAAILRTVSVEEAERIMEQVAAKSAGRTSQPARYRTFGRTAR